MITVRVKGSEMTAWPISFALDCTVVELKQKLVPLSGNRPTDEQMRLFHCGRELQDTHLLSQYELRDSDVLHQTFFVNTKIPKPLVPQTSAIPLADIKKMFTILENLHFMERPPVHVNMPHAHVSPFSQIHGTFEGQISENELVPEDHEPLSETLYAGAEAVIQEMASTSDMPIPVMRHMFRTVALQRAQQAQQPPFPAAARTAAPMPSQNTPQPQRAPFDQQVQPSLPPINTAFDTIEVSEEVMLQQIQALQQMGFYDEQETRAALQRAQGDLDGALNILFGNE